MRNKNKPFDKAASEAIARLQSVIEFMNKEGKWYNKINSETQYLVDNYIANGKDIGDLEDLEARGDVFYKEINVVDKTGLAAKIKELANGNKQKEEDLLLAINTFYKKWPTSNKNIGLPLRHIMKQQQSILTRKHLMDLQQKMHLVVTTKYLRLQILLIV